MTLTVVVPVYNERATAREILRRVAAHPAVTEILVVDDASTDGTREILREMETELAPRMRLFVHDRNRGKGAALRTAFVRATGEWTLVQDADLEYDPADYDTLLAPIREGRADVVYGSRFAGRRRMTWHTFGNLFLTWLSNLTTRIHLTDMETGFKLFRTSLLRRIRIRSDRFSFEPEITAKLARLRCRIVEVPIAYRARSYAEGKKIKWKDGCAAVWMILRNAL